jgi:CRP-like cAMP-binding protein
LARHAYLVVDGKIALEIAGPLQDRLSFDLIAPGEVAGCSALFLNERWGFDARSVGATTTIALDGRSLRKCCESNHEFGYRLLQKCVRALGRRLDASRAKLIEAHSSVLP